MPSASFSIPDEVEELLTGYVLGILAEQERLKIEVMLAQSPALWDEVRQLEAVLGLVAQQAAVQASSTLRFRILSAAQSQVAQSQAVQPQPSVRKRPLRWAVAVALGLMALLGIIAYQNLQLRTQVARLESQVKTLEGHVQQTFTLQGTVVASASQGNVVIDLEEARAQIKLYHLPVLGQGEIYQMWAITKGKTVACGSVKPDANGKVMVNIPVPVQQYAGQVSQLFITRESVPKPHKPSQLVVMRSVIS
ncbi:MAG TPA: anti-sigma factor [Stenomitos sp.]